MVDWAFDAPLTVIGTRNSGRDNRKRMLTAFIGRNAQSFSGS